MTGAIWKAQTFAPGTGYGLSFVDLGGNNLGGETTLHIKSTAANGAPIGPDLATVTINAGNRFLLSAPLPLTGGERYALALSNSGGSFGWSYSASSTCYPNPAGHPLTSLDGGQTWSFDIVDFLFVLYDSTSTPQPSATPTPVPTLTPRPPSRALVQPVVFVIGLPFGSPLYDPLYRSVELIDKLEEASRYHGYANADARPYLRYQIYGNTVHWMHELPPRLASGYYDIGWVYAQYNLCALIQSGAVDEVWLWDAGQGGFLEWVIAGPDWSVGCGSNAPNCGKQTVTMIFNYNREIDVALESYHHRVEGTLMHYVPCDFWTRTWPWTGWPQQCADLVCDQTGFVARPFAGNGFVGGCGDAHHPPNILISKDYIYDDRTTVRTTCPDWSQDGSAVVSEVDCSAWGCTHWGYHVWWLQNMPGPDATNRDREGRLHGNWWAYVVSRSRQQVHLPHIGR